MPLCLRFFIQFGAQDCNLDLNQVLCPWVSPHQVIKLPLKHRLIFQKAHRRNPQATMPSYHLHEKERGVGLQVRGSEQIED